MAFGLYLPHCHATPCDVHRAARPVLVVLAVPDQLDLPPEEWMGIFRPPASGFRHGGKPPDKSEDKEKLYGRLWRLGAELQLLSSS